MLVQRTLHYWSTTKIRKAKESAKFIFLIDLILYCAKFFIYLIWYVLKKHFNMFRLTLSLVGKWPVKNFNFRLGSQAAGKFPVGVKNFAQH